MATFFGEVLQVSSRAFWEDDDDEEGEVESAEKSSIFHLNTYPHDDGNYEFIIFATDDVSAGFVSSCIISEKSKIIATVERIETFETKSKQHIVVGELYAVNNNVLLFKLIKNVNISEANEVVSLVIPWLEKSKECIVLTSKSSREFKSLKSKNIKQPYFIQSLKTKEFKGNTLCPNLECTNAVAGFPASVINLCQVKNQSCVLYIYFYTDSLPLTLSVTVEPLFDLFKKLPLYKSIEIGIPEGCAKRINIHNYVVENSNLYV